MMVVLWERIIKKILKNNVFWKIHLRWALFRMVFTLL